MARVVQGIGVALEVVGVFVAAAVVGRAAALPPLARWALLATMAGVVDWAARRRGPIEWGVKTGDLSGGQVVATTLRLLVIGGLVPLLLTLVRPPVGHGPAAGWLGLLGAVLIPLLAQEVFLVGYVQRRLLDVVRPATAVAAVSVLFMLAHAAHANEGAIGGAFVLAMGWQGACWAVARLAWSSLIPQMAAHAILLVLYARPSVGVVAVSALGLAVLPGSRRCIALGARRAKRR
jgi:membrane protease YdiL (CAAX protease family)